MMADPIMMPLMPKCPNLPVFAGMKGVKLLQLMKLSPKPMTSSTTTILMPTMIALVFADSRMPTTRMPVSTSTSSTAGTFMIAPVKPNWWMKPIRPVALSTMVGQGGGSPTTQSGALASEAGKLMCIAPINSVK